MNNDEKLWQIEGYLLGDPTIDRDLFEQQMLEDPALALQVAEVSEQLERLAMVARQADGSSSCSPVSASLSSTAANPLTQPSTQSSSRSTQSSRSTESTRASRQVYLAVMAISAALLMALIPWLVRRNREPLDDFAVNWLALVSEVTSESNVSNTTADLVSETEPVESESIILPAALASNEDWLIDSAVIFFSDSGS